MLSYFVTVLLQLPECVKAASVGMKVSVNYSMGKWKPI